jgi:hypothetical protein
MTAQLELSTKMVSRTEVVAATAMSAKRSVAVEVSEDGFVVGVRLLSPAVRRWDSWDLGERVVAVAAVAHDRYLANLPDREGIYPKLRGVGADERKLIF